MRLQVFSSFLAGAQGSRSPRLFTRISAAALRIVFSDFMTKIIKSAMSHSRDFHDDSQPFPLHIDEVFPLLVIFFLFSLLGSTLPGRAERWRDVKSGIR